MLYPGLHIQQGTEPGLKSGLPDSWGQILNHYIDHLFAFLIPEVGRYKPQTTDTTNVCQHERELQRRDSLTLICKKVKGRGEPGLTYRRGAGANVGRGLVRFT